jgi:hypothetical protein
VLRLLVHIRDDLCTRPTVWPPEVCTAGHAVHGGPVRATSQAGAKPEVAPAVRRLIDDSGIGTQLGRLRVSYTTS